MPVYLTVSTSVAPVNDFTGSDYSSVDADHKTDTSIADSGYHQLQLSNLSTTKMTHTKIKCQFLFVSFPKNNSASFYLFL